MAVVQSQQVDVGDGHLLQLRTERPFAKSRKASNEYIRIRSAKNGLCSGGAHPPELSNHGPNINSELGYLGNKMVAPSDNIISESFSPRSQVQTDKSDRQNGQSVSQSDRQTKRQTDSQSDRQSHGGIQKLALVLVVTRNLRDSAGRFDIELLR